MFRDMLKIKSRIRISYEYYNHVFQGYHDFHIIFLNAWSVNGPLTISAVLSTDGLFRFLNWGLYLQSNLQHIISPSQNVSILIRINVVSSSILNKFHFTFEKRR